MFSLLINRPVAELFIIGVIAGYDWAKNKGI
ncbi:Uncharacterised protein [Shewanella putrefaciens]|nr:Uncharacterised protein [Shewanella putrefaciens]